MTIDQSQPGTAPGGPDAPAAPAAFFDLDRTLVRGSSGFAILIEMRRAGIIRRRHLIRDSWVGARFRLFGVDDRTADTIRARVGGYVAGVPQAALEAIADAALGRVVPRIFPVVLARVRAHQAAGEPVFLVTASSQEFADLLAEELGFDGAVGTRSEVVDGHYTGRPGGPFVYGEGKVQALAELSERHGLDLGASTAYSDALSDVPMLRAVGRPVAVNPDRGLRSVAASEGWEVLRVDSLFARLGGVRAALGAALAIGLAGALARRVRHEPTPE